jgi:hypothetical protein
MNKENTKSYICCRIQDNTEKNLNKALEILSEITNDEGAYNYELSNATHKMRLKIVDILKEVYINNKY